MQSDAAISSGQAVSYGSVEDGTNVKFEPESKTPESEIEEEAVEEAPMPDWEARGTIVGLIIDVASVSAHRIFVLVMMMVGLDVARKDSMKCSLGEESLLESYGEELFCHYTKSFVFCFPAIATGVLLCLMGRDLLQKRLYYGLLKAGAAISYTENVAYKDPFFMALVVNFLHCVAFYVFNVNVLSRKGEDVIEQPDVQVTVPPTMTTTPAAAFAVMGYNQTHVANIVGTHAGQMSEESMNTLKLLALNFMPSILVIVFIFLAYDITMTLVPLSEYLRAFEAEDESPVPDLCTFQDAIAKRLLEKSPEMVEAAGSNLQTLYEMIVDKYRRHKAELHGGIIRSKSLLPSAKAAMDIADGTESMTSPRWGKGMKDLATIGLTKSLWPADLLLRLDVEGEGVQNFRVFWTTFAICALVWLGALQLHLIYWVWAEAQEVAADPEQAIPLVINLVHMVAVGVVIHVYCTTLLPLYQTRTMTSARSTA